MRIKLGSVTVTDLERRAVWWYFNGAGYKGNPKTCPKASREDTKQTILDLGLMAVFDDLTYSYQSTFIN